MCAVNCCCYFCHLWSRGLLSAAASTEWLKKLVTNCVTCKLQTGGKPELWNSRVDGQVLCTWRENRANDRTFLHQTPKDHVPVQWSWVVLTLMVTNQYRVIRDSSGLRMPLWTKASMQLKNEIFQAVLEEKELLVVRRKLALTEREAGWQVLVVLEGEV